MKIRTFHPGGMHIPDHKELTKDLPIVKMTASKDLVYPLSQHIGVPSEAIVKKDDVVKMGQLIAKSQGNFSTNIHSSVSGVVKDIKDYPHPIQGLAPAIHIENDFNYTVLETIKPFDLTNSTKDELLQHIQNSGIVGMGGATFPTHMKLQPPPEANVDVLIINGAECEPYLTCDHRIMLERVSLILDGIEILQKYFSFKKIYIGIEVNKLNAIHLLEDSISNLQSNLPVEVIPLQKKYPQGAEKNLIEAITKRVVPISKLPFSVGCIVQNVATIAEISSAVRTGVPLTKRVLTATGDCLKDPKNLEVPIGTLLSDIVDFCGGFIKEPKELIFGGPMMGINQRSQDVPVLKGTSGIIFLQKLEDLNETSCIRCGRCVTNCPMGLMPYRFVELTMHKKYLDTNDYFVSSCIECGLCTYNCPARIPILNYIRLSKNEIKHARRHS